MGADDIESLLVRLASRPGDADLRLQTAEVLDAQGKADAVAAILATFVNLTGHDDDAGLPCLCKACLPTAPLATESNGFAWTRSFAVVGTRVLHFWQLADQHRAQVRASVTASLRTRLKRVG